MNTLERIILGIPYVLLKKMSYLWLLIVFFYTWPPVLSTILFVLLVLSMVLIKDQREIWEASIRRTCKEGNASLYVDRPKAPFSYQIRNLVLVLLAGIGLGYFLDGTVAWVTSPQWFLLAVGFFLLQKDLNLFGAPTVYFVTDDGLWLGYVTLHLFFKFNEIRQVLRVRDVKKKPERWAELAPVRNIKDGLLLHPVNPSGFTRLLDEIFLAPTNVNEFLRHIPVNLVHEKII